MTIDSALGALPMWTIYDHPTDHSDVFIARKWLMRAGIAETTDDVIRATALETLRAQMRLAGMTRIPRRRDDDPVIVESWI